MKVGDIALWRGLLKGRILKVLPDQCLVEALENFSAVWKGEQFLARNENLQKVKAKK